MLKRGQVTLFLIIGIVLLALFSGIFYLVSKTTGEKITIGQDTPFELEIKPRITNFVENCLEQVGAPAILLAGEQGGYLELKEESTLFTENESIAYSWQENKNVLDQTEIEAQLSRYLESHLNNCLQDFQPFSTENLDIKSEPPAIQTDINTEFVLFKLTLPLTVIKDKEEASLKEFSREVPLRLGLALKNVEDINEKHRYLYGWNPLLFTPYAHFVTILPFSEGITFLSLYDPQPYKEQHLVFLTAIDHSGKNRPPKMGVNPDRVLAQGISFSTNINAEDPDQDALRFTTDNPSINIDEGGMMNFTPNVAGTFYVNVTVTDPLGLSDSQIIRIVVEKEIEGSS